jgi:hypothetical protein
VVAVVMLACTAAVSKFQGESPFFFTRPRLVSTTTLLSATRSPSDSNAPDAFASRLLFVMFVYFIEQLNAADAYFCAAHDSLVGVDGPPL